MSSNNVPPFLVKSTLACSLVLNVVLLPFLMNAVINGRWLLAILILMIELACLYNAWEGLKNRYNLALNTYFISPLGTIAISYAFFKLGPVGSYWPFVLLMANYFVLPEKRAWVFTAMTLMIFIPGSWSVLPVEFAARFSATLLITSLFMVFSLHQIYNLHALLEEEITKDSLTRLYNRSSLKSYLEHAIAQSDRSQTPLTLISIDIDHFKSINDNFGHDQGDNVLVNFGLLLRSRVRESDRAFRVGGEEFLICLHDTNEQDGTLYAETLREHVEQQLLLSNYPITISAGVCEYKQGMTQSAWLKACDKKLYQAKITGRNRVVSSLQYA